MFSNEKVFIREAVVNNEAVPSSNVVVSSVGVHRNVSKMFQKSVPT